MGSHRDSRQTTVEAVVQTRKSTGSITYFAKSNTTELFKITSTATSERSGRIPDLKTTTSVSSSASSAATTGTQESSLLEESGVETKHNPTTIYLLVGTLRHYGRVIWQ